MMTDTLGCYTVSVALVNESGDRRSRSESAMRLVLGGDQPIVRRLDGKPESMGERSVSAAHLESVTMAVAGPSPAACDIEPVTARDIAIWNDLLGADRFKLAQVLSRMTGGDFDVAATRVWAAMECLRKAGAPVNAPLTLSGGNERCAMLSSGRLSIVTVCVMIDRGIGRTVLAALSSLNRSSLSDNCGLDYEPAGLGARVMPG